MKTKKETFKPETKTIKEFFSKTIYFVPEYQRLYSWTDDPIIKLWDDFYEAYINKKSIENYFLGSIITVPADKGVDLIDGQQRITTLTILFATICEMYEVDEDFRKKYLAGADDEIRRLKRLYLHKDNPKLVLQKQDNLNVGFNTFITQTIKNRLRNGDLKKPKAGELKGGDQDKKYENALFIFRERLKNFDKNLKGFIEFILNQIIFIKVECTNLPFAIKLFQIINDRGLDLTTADIVKSYLLGSLNDKKQEESYNEVKKTWDDSMKQIANLHSNDMSNYLNCYIHYLIESTPKIGVSSIVEKIIASQGEKKKLEDLSITNPDSQAEASSPVEFAEGLNNFIRRYKDVYLLTNKHLYSLVLLPWDTVWVPILSASASLSCSIKEKERLYKSLVKYFYINYVADKTYNQIKQTCLTILKQIKNQEAIEKIIETIEKEITDKLLIDFKNNILDSDVFNKKWIRNVLIYIEYFVKDAKERIIVDKDIHVEHILPVKWYTNEKNEWGHITKEVADKYLYSLGNLTLLNYKKNILAQNEGYETKIKIYKGEHEKIKEKTGYAITQKIIENYDASTKTWDESAIGKRRDYLLEKLLDVFDIDKERFGKLGVISNK